MTNFHFHSHILQSLGKNSEKHRRQARNGPWPAFDTPVLVEPTGDAHCSLFSTSACSGQFHRCCIAAPLLESKTRTYIYILTQKFIQTLPAAITKNLDFMNIFYARRNSRVFFGGVNGKKDVLFIFSQFMENAQSTSGAWRQRQIGRDCYQSSMEDSGINQSETSDKQNQSICLVLTTDKHCERGRRYGRHEDAIHNIEQRIV